MRPGYQKELRQLIEYKELKKTLSILDTMAKTRRDSIPCQQIHDIIKEMKNTIESKTKQLNAILLETE